MQANEIDITLRRDPASERRVYWHLCDTNGRTIWPFLDFVVDCVDVMELNHKTIEGRAYALLKWYRFLAEKSVDMWDACDETMKDFRDSLMKHVSVNSSKDLQARRRTINLDLRNIYLYYAWLQDDPHYGAGRRLLGPSMYQITSTLNTVVNSKRQRGKRYPMTFKNAGENSKHRLGFVPEEIHRAALTEYFYDIYPPHIANRNCLIFEIAWTVGWRRGSILSLTTSDFEPARISTGEDFVVRPAVQKFGYARSFVIPGRLVLRILDFIDNHRLISIKKMDNLSSALFLNLETGLSITPGAVSNLFSRARRSLGWPQGGGLHAWRRGFTNGYLERELDSRIELGLDTSGETIAMSVAQALGQESLRSQAAYVRDARRRIRGTATFRDKEEHARLSDENARLRGEVATLVRALARK